MTAEARKLSVKPFPRAVLIAVGLLLGFVLVMVAIARMTGFMIDQASVPEEIQARDIRFAKLPTGKTAIYDIDNGVLIRELTPGSAGFIEGVLRGMNHQRSSHGADETEPYHLARHANGEITLTDPITGVRLNLRAFGPSNQAVFAELMSEASAEAP